MTRRSDRSCIALQHIPKALKRIARGVVVNEHGDAGRDQQVECRVVVLAKRAGRGQPFGRALPNDGRDDFGELAGIFVRQVDSMRAVVEGRHGRSVVGRARAKLDALGLYAQGTEQALNASTATHGTLTLAMTR